jgi:CRP-like cAMP-binding protein
MTRVGCNNALLAALPDADRQNFVERSEPVGLALGHVLCKQGERVSHIYFPISGFVSLMAEVDGRPALEVALVGAEGAVGASLILGIDVLSEHARVQAAGSALRMDAAQFVSELERSKALQGTMNRYVHVLMHQRTQMAVCTRFHVVEKRLARWLLTARDRAQSNEFYATHQSIASLLGVRRVGITRAASMLQRRRLVRYNRGRITVIDVRRLELAACACYSAVSNVYSRPIA